MSGRAHDVRPELAGLVPRDRAELLRRERVVLEINALFSKGRAERFRAHDIVKTYVALLRAKGVRVSASAVWKWRREYRLGGLAALVDQRKAIGRPAAARRAGSFLRAYLRHYRGGLRHTTERLRRETAFNRAQYDAERKGWGTCSRREADRWLGGQLAGVQGEGDRSAREGGSTAV